MRFALRPATSGESRSSFWRSGLQAFCSRKVAFSRSPRTTARNSGVSPFRVRHWAAPGGDAGTHDDRVNVASGPASKRATPPDRSHDRLYLRRRSPGPFGRRWPRPRAAGSILARPLWTESPFAPPVGSARLCPLKHQDSTRYYIPLFWDHRTAVGGVLPSLIDLKISSGSSLGVRSLRRESQGVNRRREATREDALGGRR